MSNIQRSQVCGEWVPSYSHEGVFTGTTLMEGNVAAASEKGKYMYPTDPII